jgi:single-stranded-DNA-specific exonuclease
VIEITRDLQIKGGGHEMACGLTIPRDKFDEFRNRVLGCASERLTADDLVPVVEADCEVSGRDLDLQLARDLEKLEPCGTGNPEAKLMLRGARIVDGKTIGEHVKWFVESDGQKFEAVWWRPGERASGFGMGKVVDLCFVPELNHWNGNTRLQLVIKEAKLK